MIHKTLHAVIGNIVNKAISSARDNKDLYKGEAINWGDLQFVSADLVIDLDTSAERIVVTIAEAAPEAFGLQTSVQEALRRAGITADVVTEW